MTPQVHHVDNQTPYDLMVTFPEALPIIKRNLKIYHDAKKNLEPVYSELLDALLEYIYLGDGTEEDKAVAFVTRRFYDNPVDALEKHIKRLTHLHYLYTHQGPVSAGSITDAHVAEAKTFPIRNIIDVNRSGFIRCPFHAERTPSCKVFQDNKFRCFGCGANGDVIDLVQKINNASFLDAVKFILKR